MAIGRVGRAGPGQQWAESKSGRAKILTTQPALKTGRSGQIVISRQKKLGRTGPGHTGPSQIWPGFFRVKSLMAQPGPNFGRTGLAHRAGPILPPLDGGKFGSTFRANIIRAQSDPNFGLVGLAQRTELKLSALIVFNMT